MLMWKGVSQVRVFLKNTEQVYMLAYYLYTISNLVSLLINREATLFIQQEVCLSFRRNGSEAILPRTRVLLCYPITSWWGILITVLVPCHCPCTK